MGMSRSIDCDYHYSVLYSRALFIFIGYFIYLANSAFHIKALPTFPSITITIVAVAANDINYRIEKNKPGSQNETTDMMIPAMSTPNANAGNALLT